MPTGSTRSSNRLPALAAVSLGWLAGCVGAPARLPEPQTGRPAPAAAPSDPKLRRGLAADEVQRLDPRAFAARFRRPAFCEHAARALHSASRDKAWAVLSACADKGNFTLLDRLAEDPWREDLAGRPDAQRVVAKVIAARGGDAAGDAARLRDRGAPFFPLEPAVKQPDGFRGRLVILRAVVADVPGEPRGTTLRLLARGAGPGERELLGHLAQPDPLLEPGKDLVFVARFEGADGPSSDGGRVGDRIAVLSLIGYSEPAAAVVE